MRRRRAWRRDAFPSLSCSNTGHTPVASTVTLSSGRSHKKAADHHDDSQCLAHRESPVARGQRPAALAEPRAAALATLECEGRDVGMDRRHGASQQDEERRLAVRDPNFARRYGNLGPEPRFSDGGGGCSKSRSYAVAWSASPDCSTWATCVSGSSKKPVTPRGDWTKMPIRSRTSRI